MEISKDDTIFTIIDNISLNKEENIENIIKVEVGNSDIWSEDNYFNFTNIMTSEGYIKEEEPQIFKTYETRV